MALRRKIDALMALRLDTAVVSEAGGPGRHLDRVPALAVASVVCVGTGPDKRHRLAGFGSTRLEFNRHHHDGRLHCMPLVAVNGLLGMVGPVHLLGVCATQNGS